MNSTNGQLARARILYSALALGICAPWITQAAAAETFELNEVSIEGCNQLPEAELRQAIIPFMGPDKTVADIGAARAAIEAAYHKDGFPGISVIVPQQHAGRNHGVFVLKVIQTSSARTHAQRA